MQANWGDDGGDDETGTIAPVKSKTIALVDGELPESTTTVSDGYKHVTTYKRRDDGKIEKRTKVFRLESRVATVSEDVVRRRGIKKFGVSKGLPPGPDTASTNIVMDDVFLVLQSKKDLQDDKEPEIDTVQLIADAASKRMALLRAGIGAQTEGGGGVSQGGVYTPPIGGRATNVSGAVSGGGVYKPPTEGRTAGAGAYVPPGQREGAGRATGGYSDRDDSNTVRVTNLSENTREDDLRDLFKAFGAIKRCYLATDRVTGQARGFAFISFLNKQDAQNAIDALNGYGYDHLILSCEWAEERKEGDSGGGSGTGSRPGGRY